MTIDSNNTGNTTDKKYRYTQKVTTLQSHNLTVENVDEANDIAYERSEDDEDASYTEFDNTGKSKDLNIQMNSFKNAADNDTKKEPTSPLATRWLKDLANTLE